jgi:hypothetical protein
MTLVQFVEHLRVRRAVARHDVLLRTNDGLFDAARDLRRHAQLELNAGRPDLAEPFIEEAEMFESATQRVPRL